MGCHGIIRTFVSSSKEMSQENILHLGCYPNNHYEVSMFVLLSIKEL